MSRRSREDSEGLVRSLARDFSMFESILFLPRSLHLLHPNFQPYPLNDQYGIITYYGAHGQIV